MRLSVFVFLICSIIFQTPLFAQSTILGGNTSARSSKMQAPVALGPQYLLTYSRTRFEPDTAFSLKAGEWLATMTYVQSNSFVYSSNNDKNINGIVGDPSYFHPDTDRVYSVYMDSEITERTVRLVVGLSDSLEFQLAYRDLALVPGTMDLTIEDFHRQLDLGTQDREKAERRALDIYVWDNEENKMIFKRTQTSEDFQTLAYTVGFKYTIRKTENEALAFKWISNFDDEYAENDLNEATSDAEYNYKRFDDYNWSLNYTSQYDYFTLHAAYAETVMKTPIFEKSPDKIRHYFIGANIHFSETFDLLVQDLIYTSIYPVDKSNIGNDVNEFTMGLRNYIGDSFTFEVGFVENYSHGPNNIDISFFASVAGLF